MGAFKEGIAEAVKRESRDPRYQSSLAASYPALGGRVFFVLKTAATNYTQFAEDHPDYKSGDGVATIPAVYNTVDAAIGACTAAQGDVIYVMPGHTETVTATSIALDISGVTIIGLGVGKNRPVLTYGAAAATITVSAANCAVYNIHHIANFDNVAAAYTLAAAKDFRLDGNEFVDNSDALHFVSIVVTGATDNDADGLSVVGNYWYALALAPDAFISILAAELRLYVADNHVDMAATNDAGHFITLAAKIISGARILRNVCNVVSATGATVGLFLTGSGTTSTGIVAYNFVTSLDVTSPLFATAATNLQFFENRLSTASATSGKLWPAAMA